jgi:hypothetical protein
MKKILFSYYSGQVFGETEDDKRTLEFFHITEDTVIITGFFEKSKESFTKVHSYFSFKNVYEIDAEQILLSKRKKNIRTKLNDQNEYNPDVAPF